MEKLEQLEKDFIKMRDDVAEIKIALLGNSYNDGEGMAFKLIENEKRLENIERWREAEQQRRSDREKSMNAFIRWGGLIFAVMNALQAILMISAIFKK